MSRRQKPFIFYTVDTPTGLAYYFDSNGNIKKAPISLGMGPNGMDISMQRAPDGWLNSELGFLRNTRLYGINRAYTVPQKLVDEAASLVRQLMNGGIGIEVPLSMLIFMYDDDAPVGGPLYTLLYKGQLDLPNHTDIAGEGFQVNLMEGGFLRLLKTYENTIIEIPCDGSIPENIKVNLDGMYVQDTLTFEFVPMQGANAQSGNGVNVIAMTLVDQDGDSFGVQIGEQTYENVPASGTYPQTSQNFSLSFQSPTTVNLSGSITVRPFNSNHPAQFNLGWFTSLAIGDQILGGGHSGLGIPNRGAIPAGAPLGTNLVWVTQETTFNFNFSVPLGIAENFFLYWSDVEASQNMFIVGGTCIMKFNSMPPATAPWCIPWFDVFRLLVINICQIASNATQTYNYGFQSQLLQDNLNLVLTSGDALRASGDPNYLKFYNALQNNPNFPNINNYYSFGPVIKTSLSECFDSVNAILNASMSTQILPGENETIFVESKGYVFNSSVVNLENGEVVDFKSQPALDLHFTLFRVGYTPQTTDQKSGKYSWATTAEWQTPFLSIPSKTFEVICKYITDPFVIQRLTANINDTSYTRNSSDNSVFVINTDPTTSTYDSYDASFTSQNVFPANPDMAGNTNIKLTVNESQQSVNTTQVLGNYLSFSNDAAIFLFSQSTLSIALFTLKLTIFGNLAGLQANVLNGTPADTMTIKLWYNGTVLQSWTITATSPSTTITDGVHSDSIQYTVNQNFRFKDCLYITCSTSATGTANLDSVELSVGNTENYFTATGAAIVVQPGIPSQLIALPTVDAINDGFSHPVISSGFQYFNFNSILINNNFNALLQIAGYTQGGTDDHAGWDVYLNGQVQHSGTYEAVGVAVKPFNDGYAFNRNFQDGDILFMVASATNLSVWITAASILLTSTQIKALALKRVQYDNITGIPALLGNLPGTAIPITTGPGAPYNIEQLTPKRMMMAWFNYLKSILFDQPGSMLFCSLSKNEYLSTTYKGMTITENANVPTSSMGAPLFLPRWLTYKNRVQTAFAKTMTGAANGHVSNTVNTIPFYGFPWEMKQKVALNEMMEWKMLASPLCDLTQLDNLDISGINFLNMAPNSIVAVFLNGTQWVPEGVVINPKYHTKSRNLFWYSEQVSKWINQNNYWQPWMQIDTPTHQFITRDLTEVSVNLYLPGPGGPALITTVAATEKFSPAINNAAGYHLWEVKIPFTGLTGGYYMTAVGGGGVATLISEGQYIKPDWPNTLLFEYTNSTNRQSLIFDTGTIFCTRLRGFYDNMFKQKYKGVFYTDQMQDSKIINAFPYELTSLFCGADDGIPDYMFKKIARIMLLDGTMIEGEGFSIDEGAEWEVTTIQGNPKKYVKIDIRPSENVDGVGATAAGADTDASMMISLDAGAFSPNAGNMGGSNPDIITVTINS